MEPRGWVERELLRLWRKAFGQPPVLMGDRRLMVELLRAAQGARRRRAENRS